MTGESQGLAALRREVFASQAITLQTDHYCDVLERILDGKRVKAGEVGTVVVAPVAAARDMQISARRYADSRSSYVTGEVNEHTRVLLALGIPLNTADGSVWARDGMYGYAAYAHQDRGSSSQAIPVSPGVLLEAIRAEAQGRELPTARLARLIAGDTAALEEPITSSGERE
ncbi:hypothetical protein Dcar01_03693 [Deinococcus carri]|uniref:Uncharacterized protein n=1 Tax=Deinococcus carri TaxID=1211323 RepID=A0ABP9WC75_9DEIO